MKNILISCVVILSLTSIVANPTEKDEDQSIGKDITEWFEKAFENIKGAFDKHECFVEETFRGRKSKVGDTCHFYEDCIKHDDDEYYYYYTKDAYCELKTWASIIQWLLIVVILIVVAVIMVLCFPV